MPEFTLFPSPAGEIYIEAENGFITRIDFSAQPLNLPRNDDDPLLIAARNWLQRYFAGQKPDPSELPVKLCGSAFQKRVWEILKTIPYGCAVTYGDIAKQLSAAMSAQAVGGAVGKNPICIVIPCHRVLGANSRITGFTGGLDKKRVLLALEGIPYKE